MALPRLLYLGDVAVESSYHGSALLFRLLSGYAEDHLMVLEGEPWRSREERRLKGVLYGSFPIGWGRALNSRLAKPYGSAVLTGMPRKWRRVESRVQDFKPGAVLTVVHGYSWLAAAEFAVRNKLPLHLILHDDWLTSLQVFDASKKPAEKMLRGYYRYATSRLCVSPAMAEQYEQRFGVAGEVLCPIRAADSPVASAAVARPLRGPITVGYAGTINGAGYIERLISMARALDEHGGRLMIYGPLTAEHAQQIGLGLNNVIVHGLLTSRDLIERLREEIDILFLPMSFKPDDRVNMEYSFPSKLTDYTAVGLPVLINGPNYCSAVRWARDNPGTAEVVETETTEALADALRGLVKDDERRRSLAAAALRQGERHFSYPALASQFRRALQSLGERN